MKGWHYESARHALAARGVRTYLSEKADYNIKFKPVHSKEYDYEAVGTDIKGRRVRKYSPEHHELQARKKYERVRALRKRNGAVVQQMKEDMGSENESVRRNARVAYIIAQTGMRPGTRKEMRADQTSKGVTTLHKDDVRVEGGKAVFAFTGKHGIPIHVNSHDAGVVRAVKGQRKEAKGRELFPHTSDATVRRYLEGRFGNVKAKDFRTLKATERAEELKGNGMRKERVLEKVSKELGNTPRVSEHSYVDPKVFA